MLDGSGTGVPPEDDPVPPEEPAPPVDPVDVPLPDEPELPQPELPHPELPQPELPQPELPQPELLQPLVEPRLSLLQVASAGALATTASAAAAVQIVYFISFIVELHSHVQNLMGIVKQDACQVCKTRGLGRTKWLTRFRKVGTCKAYRHSFSAKDR